jgi:AraC family transcriptional regulator
VRNHRPHLGISHAPFAGCYGDGVGAMIVRPTGRLGFDLAMSSSVATPEFNSSSVVSSETPMPEALTQELSVVAAQLIEAACRARDGDREATKAHIAHAVALLRGKPSVGPRSKRVLSNAETQVARGSLLIWQARRVFAHVEANLSRKILIRELARSLGLSASHFCRVFKCTFGVSPRDYMLRRRIEVAQALMLTTSEPLSSIAVRCGMCDQPHFTRSFHRIVGETPYAWRRTRRATLKIASP